MVVFVVVIFVLVVVIFIVIVFFPLVTFYGRMSPHMLKLRCTIAIIRNLNLYVGFLLGLNGATLKFLKDLFSCICAAPRSLVMPSVQLVVPG